MVSRKEGTKTLIVLIVSTLLVLPAFPIHNQNTTGTLIDIKLPSSQSLDYFYFNELNNWTEEVSIIVDTFVINTTCYAITPYWLYIYDISDIEEPILLSSTYRPYDFNTIYVQNNLAFIASSYGDINIYNVSNPYDPNFCYLYYIENEINDIFVNGTYIYLSLYYSGVEIHNITSYWSIEILGFYHNYLSYYIIYEDNMLFVTDYSDTYVLNVTDPTNITLLTSIPISGHIAVENNLLFWTGYNEVRIYDISDIDNIVQISSYDFTPNSFSVFVKVKNDIMVVGFENEEGFMVLNYSNPTQITLLGRISDGGLIKDCFINGSYLFTAEIWDGCEIYDLNNLSTENKIAHLQANGKYDDIVLNNRTIFLARGCCGFSIYNITDSWSLVELSNYDDVGIYHRLYVRENILFALCQGYGIKIFNIADLTDPILIGEYHHPSMDIYDFDINGNLMVIAAGLTGALLIDISNLFAPYLLATLTQHYSYISHIFIEQDILFSCDNGNIAYIFDCSDISDVTLITTMNRKIVGVESYENYIVISSSMIEIYDFSDKENPVRVGYEVTILLYQMYLSDSVAFCGIENGIRVYDIQDSNDITLIAEYTYDPGYRFPYDTYQFEFFARINWYNGLTIILDELLGFWLFSSDIYAA
ncbi:MAG: hypothetical protein FK734_20205 [Asgard group archaeon]|nr:hypothetical protein [Asgard group archaeon]